MVAIEFDNSRMIQSNGNKTVVTDFKTGTIKFFEKGSAIDTLNFDKMSLATYLKLIRDFFPGQIIRYD